MVYSMVFLFNIAIQIFMTIYIKGYELKSISNKKLKFSLSISLFVILKIKIKVGPIMFAA